MPSFEFKADLKLQEGTFAMVTAELLGTAILIFIGCMGCIGTWGSTPPPPLQTAFTFGMTLNGIIMIFGPISGAHLNPSVTLGAIMIGLKSIPTGILYMIAQYVGAIMGYGMIKAVTPFLLMNDGYPQSTTPLCVTVIHPQISLVQATLIEILCTSIILIGACATWDPRHEHLNDSTPLKFGFAVSAIALAAGPYTGCSMNPARTFGPAIWNGIWQDQWVYFVGPMVGGILGTLLYKYCFAQRESSKNNNNGEVYELAETEEAVSEN